MPQENYAAKQQRIGERLTRAMAKAHMNRSELAELTGYSVEQIVSWERGRARMYPIELIKLCHALDVKPEWLLCWERQSILRVFFPGRSFQGCRELQQ
jgi:transcriptional regulator with XRE-family HTH domain